MKTSKMHKRFIKATIPRTSPTGRTVVFDMEYQDLLNAMSRYERPEPTLKADKGHKAGSCNRTACQRSGAVWWNRGSYSWYCTDCAVMLNRANAGDSFCKDEPLCSLNHEALAEFKSVHGEDFDELVRVDALMVAERYK